jgi:hypothetical protein
VENNAELESDINSSCACGNEMKQTTGMKKIQENLGLSFFRLSLSIL